MIKTLFDFCEFGNPNAESITNHFSDKPYKEKDSLIAYMKTHGERKCFCGLATDFITGANIGSCMIIHDDKYSWTTNLIYYIEKYNFKPSEDFIQHVLANS